MSTEPRADVYGCARILAEHNGRDTMILDLLGLCSWTDYFVLTTASSTVHMRGLLRHLEAFLDATGIQPLRHPHLADDEEWCLLDAGDFVIHIMSAHAREFYELERLWFQAPSTVVNAPGPTGAATIPGETQSEPVEVAGRQDSTTIGPML